MSMYDKINSGKYANKVEIGGGLIPDKALRDIQQKKVRDLTDTELAQIPSLKKQFEEKKAEYRRTLELHRKEEARLNLLFEEDCAKEQGLENHPKRMALWAKAWDQGHANGLCEVWDAYQNLAELLD